MSMGFDTWVKEARPKGSSNFEDELHKDIEELADPAEHGPEADRDPPFEVVINAALEEIRNHDECLRCSFLPARMSFRVVRAQDHCSADFRLSRSWKRKLKGNVEYQVDMTVARTKELMNNEHIDHFRECLSKSHADEEPDEWRPAA